ncbi:MAG TPA: NUDIX domain-containing protein [Polyangiaceae bacterium]|nr:NUDIX domain-containing protein [Polyangiaceae bacterium]
MPAPPQAEPEVVVGAVVLDPRGRVLLVRRGRPPGAGSWSLPGGHVEAGESLAAAIVREVLEETAVHARVVCALGVVPVAREGYAYSIHEHLLVPLDPTTAEPRAGDDAVDARWVDPREAAVAMGLRHDAQAVVARGLAEARRRGLLA